MGKVVSISCISSSFSLGPAAVAAATTGAGADEGEGEGEGLSKESNVFMIASGSLRPTLDTTCAMASHSIRGMMLRQKRGWKSREVVSRVAAVIARGKGGPRGASSSLSGSWVSRVLGRWVDVVVENVVVAVAAALQSLTAQVRKFRVRSFIVVARGSDPQEMACEMSVCSTG